MRAQDQRISGEDALIAQFAELIARKGANRRRISAIGDDTAAWQPSRSNRSIITSDALIENVHFRRDLMRLYDAGYRAMAANVSDCAAAGARPVLATVTIGLPPETTQSDALQLYEGMVDCAARFGCAIAGGDCTRSESIVIAITLVGEVRPAHFKGRGGARPGDVIAVTGELGASRAGLLHRSKGVALEGALADEAENAFTRPAPRVAQGRWLAASANVRAMMDVSDGLSTDLTRMCARSSCGAVVETVPVAAPARQAAGALGEDPAAFALAGGEDFELLVAIAPRAFRHLQERYRARFRTDLHPVGHFREGSGVALRKGDGEVHLTPTGFDHFSQK